MPPRLTRQQVLAIQAKQRDKLVRPDQKLVKRIEFPTGAIYIRYAKWFPEIREWKLRGGYFQKWGDLHTPPDKPPIPELEEWLTGNPKGIHARQAYTDKSDDQRPKASPKDQNSLADRLPYRIYQLLWKGHWSRELLGSVRRARREPVYQPPFYYSLEKVEENKREHEAFMADVNLRLSVKKGNRFIPPKTERRIRHLPFVPPIEHTYFPKRWRKDPTFHYQPPLDYSKMRKPAILQHVSYK